MSDKPLAASPPTITNRPPSVPARPGSPEIAEYTPERIAEFLLSNAVSDRDYVWASAEVRRMGLDPEKIPHYRPAGVR